MLEMLLIEEFVDGIAQSREYRVLARYVRFYRNRQCTSWRIKSEIRIRLGVMRRDIRSTAETLSSLSMKAALWRVVREALPAYITATEMFAQ